MSWRPVKSIVHAVCTHRFQGTEPDDLTLEIGDDVYITEIGGPTQDWCRGWLLSHPSILNGLSLAAGQPLKPRAYAGLFPRTHVEIREVLPDDGAAPTLRHANRDGAAGTLRGRHADSADAAPIGSLTRSRSIRRTRLVHHQPNDLQLEPIDVMPRSAGAPREKAPLPALRIGDMTDFSLEEPLVDEISACLKEWYSTKLHHLLLNHDYSLLDNVSGLITRLDHARKQLIHDLLTEKELSELRESTIWELVNGNKLMDGGVIVRSPKDKGRILTAYDEIPQMLALQATMSLRSSPLPTHVKAPSLSHLLAEIKHFPDMNGETAILHMYLCRQAGATHPRPVSEVFAVELPVEGLVPSAATQLPRTLFTDLAKSEIGDTSDPSIHLYLICLLQRDEPFRTDVRKETATPTPSSTYDRSDLSSSADAANGSRRSFFARRLSLDQLRPMTSDSMRSKLPKQRAPTPTSFDPSSRPTTSSEKRVRRTLGYGAIEVGNMIRQEAASDISLSLWAPAHPLDEIKGEHRIGEDGWEDVIKTLVRSPTGQFTKVDSIGPFKLYLNAFAHTDAQSLVRSQPALLRDTHCTQPLSFVSTPQQPRSDIYLTLKEPFLPPGAKCFHPQQGSVLVAADTGLRNLQLTLEVRTESGRRIENAICPTSNRPPHTAFRTPAIDRGEAWNQTLRLSLPTEDLHESHVVLSIADGNNFPFALAWLPLWDPDTESCPQGDQDLAFWDYSEYTASTSHGRGAYQSLPSHIDQITTQNKVSMASLATSVTVTSSVNAQEPNIAALLSWDGNTVEGLMEVLESFKLAPDTEVVRFFKPLLAVLDRIFDTFYGLTDDAGAMLGELFAERALSCLVHLFHLTHDRRFTASRDALEEYIAHREPTQNSVKAVCRAFRSFLGKPYEIEAARELRSCLKVSGLLVKFITSNHGNAPRRAVSNHNNPMIPVQNAVLNLMRNPRKEVYPTQVILMQVLSSWLPELTPVSTPDEILEFIEEMMTASASKKDSLRILRLVLLRDLSSFEMFRPQEIQAKILSKTIDWLEPYWSTSETVSGHQIDGIRMCCSVIKSQAKSLSSQSLHYIVRLFEAYHLLKDQMYDETSHKEDLKPSKSGHRKTFSQPFPESYPFPTMEVETSPPHIALVEIASLLTAFFQNRSPKGKIHDHLMGADNDDALEIFVSRALQVLRSIQSGQAFPSQWISLYISHAKLSVAILQWLFDIMTASLLPTDDAAGITDIMSFNNELWELWFRTLIDLSLNKTVSMENFSEQTSRAIWTIGGDVRETAALLLRYSWESLGWKADVEYERAIFPMKRMGGFQVGLTAKLIPSVVRLCMGLHAGLRSVGLDMLRSMIISEWQLNENLELIQGAFFDTFDLISQQDGPLGKTFTSAFLRDLKSYFVVLESTTEAELYGAVVKMIQEVEKLLAVLGELTNVEEPGPQLIQLSYLADFLRLSGKVDAYTRRVHELSNVHTLTRNYSSAAYAIQMHVDVLDRSDTDQRDSGLLPRVNLSGIDFPEESKHARKTRLLQLMMTYYEKGHCWENVLDVLTQLANGRKAVWDIAGLAEVSDKQSQVYRLLAKGVKYSPRYFYVAFNGHTAFPPLLRGKQFIFEGPADCDRRGFCQALHHQFPFVINLSPEYSSPDLHSEDPAVKIIPVTPYKDHLHPIGQHSGVTAPYREHCLTAKPRIFAITDRQNVPQVSVTDQVVEKKIFASEASFPTLLSYSQIISEKRTVLSPLQAAIDRTQRKTQILSVATERVASKGLPELDALLDTVKHSVYPNADGSVSEYHRLLAAPPESSDGDTLNGVSRSFQSADLNTGNTDSEDTLLRRALSVALEDHARCIEAALASSLITSSLRMQLRTFFESTFTLELHTLYPRGDWRKKSPAWVDLAPVQDTAPKEERNGTGTTAEAEHMEPQRKQSTGRRLSLRKRLSFLSIGGKSII